MDIHDLKDLSELGDFVDLDGLAAADGDESRASRDDDEIRSASRRMRAAALMIDGTVMLMLFWGMLLFGHAIGNFEWLPGPARLVIDVIYLLLLIGCGPAYLVCGLVMFQGTTPAKWLLGMQVLRSDDSPVSVKRALVREIVVKLWLFGLSFQALLFISSLASLRADRRTLHDLALDTRVVRRSSVPAPESNDAARAFG